MWCSSWSAREKATKLLCSSPGSGKRPRRNRGTDSHLPCGRYSRSVRLALTRWRPGTRVSLRCAMPTCSRQTSRPSTLPKPTPPFSHAVLAASQPARSGTTIVHPPTRLAPASSFVFVSLTFTSPSAPPSSQPAVGHGVGGLVGCGVGGGVTTSISTVSHARNARSYARSTGLPGRAATTTSVVTALRPGNWSKVTVTCVSFVVSDV
mmetsp:Transcript_2198/g.6948  ORF Transcript_2198/g.6948 Transcript_2198/m.6948 type:complete len:207 (-) Transcript_2198:702-1322(-)